LNPKSSTSNTRVAPPGITPPAPFSNIKKPKKQKKYPVPISPIWRASQLNSLTD